MSLSVGKAVLLSLVLLAPSTLAQDCSSLDADFQGTIADGGSLTVDVAGSLEDAIVFLVIGPELGQTCLPLGMDQLCLDVAFPALVVPVGTSDASGNLSLAIDLPAASGIMIEGMPLHFQAVALRVDFGSGFGMGSMPSFETCTTNVDTVVFE